MTGYYDHDAKLANAAVKLLETPNGWVWHHVEDAKTMQLIPQEIHDFIQHTGGAAKIRR